MKIQKDIFNVDIQFKGATALSFNFQCHCQVIIIGSNENESFQHCSQLL